MEGQASPSAPREPPRSGRPPLTLGDHVGVEDEVVEEGQHVHHLVLSLCVGQLALSERLWDVGLEEVRVDGVHDL